MVYILINPLRSRENPYLLKIKTADRKTTSNVSVERYCLGYVLDPHNKHTRPQTKLRCLQKSKRLKNTLFLLRIGCKTVIANDKNRRFGVFMTPLSRKI